MPYADPNKPRVIVTLTPDEHDAFSRWAQFGGKPKLSMTVAARELFRLAVAGKVPLDRERAKRDFAGTPGVKPKKKTKA